MNENPIYCYTCILVVSADTLGLNVLYVYACDLNEHNITCLSVDREDSLRS